VKPWLVDFSAFRAMISTATDVSFFTAVVTTFTAHRLEKIKEMQGINKLFECHCPENYSI
jgi:hypothetical protein